MSLIIYSENLENYSKRLPFDFTLFLETFADFMIYYVNTKNKEDAKLVYDRYKPFVLYTIRLNSKLLDGTLLYLIPERIPEFVEFVAHRKQRIIGYYQRCLLDRDEMERILYMIEDDGLAILNQSIWSKICYVNANPTFKLINDVVKFAKNLQVRIPDLNIKEVYKWRSQARRELILRKLCCY
jgi:hypothetical protein